MTNTNNHGGRRTAGPGKQIGRPRLPADQRTETPARQLGRVDDETWNTLREAAKLAGMPFTRWAVGVLLRAAKREQKKANK